MLQAFLQKLLDPESGSRVKAEDCLADSWLTPDAQDLGENAKELHPGKATRKRRRLNNARTEEPVSE